LPLTSGNIEKVYPFEVFLPKGTGNLPKPSKVKADQIRTLDRSRIIKMIGALEKEAMSQVKEAMKCHLDRDQSIAIRRQTNLGATISTATGR